MTDASIAIVTLGCAKNEVDSSLMRRKLREAGFSLVEDADSADVVIVNTCAFIQPAIEESLDAIFSLTGAQRYENGEVQVIVAGCMPARFGDDLEEALEEISTFVPCSAEEDIVDVVCGLLPQDVVPLGSPDASSQCQDPDFAGENRFSAYVKISDGCDRFCSYCTIPFIRGRYRSFSYEDIRAEVSRCVSHGAKEITLIAQDTGRWGRDFKGDRKSLAWLMERLAEEFSDTWFRVMYVQPEGITDELLQAMADHDNICSYLDIPLQHVNPDILRNMNRKGSADYFNEKLQHIREMVPGITLRTTVIAGFPGETEEMFEELVDFIAEAGFDYVGVFPFSPEDGTKAAQLDGQLEEDVKLQRAQEVRDVADAVSSSVISSRVGRNVQVMVLGAEEDGQLYGRSQSQAPEVDGVTFVDHGEIGTIGTYQVVDTMFYEMEAELK